MSIFVILQLLVPILQAWVLVWYAGYLISSFTAIDGTGWVLPFLSEVVVSTYSK